MATKRKYPAYNPLSPYGKHSLKWMQDQANLRANTEIGSQVGALPSESWLRDSAGQLASALGGIQQNQTGVAAAGGGLYQKAFQDASNPANRAAMAAGGTGVTQTTGGQSLASTLGAMMASSMGGAQQAAVARGNNDVSDRARQVSALRMGAPTLASKYLQEMRDNAMQGSVQSFNQALAQSQFGLSASDTAHDNALGDASLAANIAGDAASSSGKESAALSKLMRQARVAATGILKGTTDTTKVTARKYFFIVPGDVTGDANGVGKQVEITAPNGADALRQIGALYSGNDPAAVQKWYTGRSEDIKQTVKQPGSRVQALEAAASIFQDEGYSRKQALTYARQIIKSRKLLKKKKPGSTATSSQSR